MKDLLNKIILGDCLYVMKDIPDKSVDMILCDLPYGTTACKWDTIIPFNKHIKEINNRGKEIILYRDEYILQEVKKGKSYKDTINYFDNNAIDGLWDNYNRIIKDRGAIVLFGSEPFTSSLIMSNIKLFKYEWIWEKTMASNFALSKKQPFKKHENILVFYRKQPIYNPQMEDGKPYVDNRNTGTRNTSVGLESNLIRRPINNKGSRYPSSVQKFSNGNNKNVHPTQKPVALLEYLIKTYTNENEIVLDNCIGSGTTAIAAIRTGRKFIGIEKDPEYHRLATERVEKEKLNLFNTGGSYAGNAE